jgi:hypothetical protein
MALAYVAIAIVCAAFAGKAIKSPYVDGDLFWQKHLGAYVLAHHRLPTALGNETFSAPGAPWVPQEWLLGIVDAIAVDHNAMWVLGIAAALALGLALLLCVSRARRFGAASPAIVVCSILTAVNAEGSFGIRAQVFAWPLFVGLLLLLDGTGAAIFLTVPLVIVWANLHASVMIAIPIVWIDALASLYQRGARDPETRRRFVLCAIVPFATLATPLGVKLPQYALMLVGSPIRHLIDEWQPVGLAHHFFWFGAVPMLLAVVLCARTVARERPRDVVLIVLLSGMTMEAVRNAALLGFVLMPVAAFSLDVLLGRFAFWKRDLLQSPGPRRLAIFGGALLTVVVFVVGIRGAPGAATWHPALDTFTKLSAQPGEQRLFCYDFAVCSPALDFPKLRIYMDGRADPYPPKVWDDFNVLRYAKPGWLGLTRSYGITAFYVKRGDKLDKALAANGKWHTLATRDTCCRLYLPGAPPPGKPGWWTADKLRFANRLPHLRETRGPSVEKHADAVQPAGGNRNEP